VGWDENRGVTIPQRSKEEAHDYRYFPEPDLPRLQIDPVWVDRIRQELPELPGAKRQRFIAEYGLNPYAADVLVVDKAVADYYEAAVEAATGATPDTIANWLSSSLFGLLNEAGITISEILVPAQALAELVDLVESGEINSVSGKAVLEQLVKEGGSPAAIIEARGLSQLDDAALISRLVEQVLQDNPVQVADYLAGKTALMEWFFGQVMRLTEGRADPVVTRTELESALAEKHQALM
jgi:aspartyl-tRNA(Asn)/glutamyl-tRNA(Gln) amidotransferase subunit B